MFLTDTLGVGIKGHSDSDNGRQLKMFYTIALLALAGTDALIA